MSYSKASIFHEIQNVRAFQFSLDNKKDHDLPHYCINLLAKKRSVFILQPYSGFSACSLQTQTK